MSHTVPVFAPVFEHKLTCDTVNIETTTTDAVQER